MIVSDAQVLAFHKSQNVYMDYVSTGRVEKDKCHCYILREIENTHILPPPPPPNNHHQQQITKQP